MQKEHEIKEYFAVVVAKLRSTRTFTLLRLQNLKVNSIALEAR